MLCLLYTPSPAYLRRPWWFCWIKGSARGQRCFHGNCRQPLRAFEKGVKLIASSSCMDWLSNSCKKQLHSNIFKPFNQKPLLPEMLQSENLQVFPPKKVFSRFQTIKLQYYTKPQKSYWIFQTKIRCTTPLLWENQCSPPHLPNSAWMLSTADKVGGVASINFCVRDVVHILANRTIGYLLNSSRNRYTLTPSQNQTIP